MIDRLDVVSIPVSDQDRAKAFYRDVLGFEELADQQMFPQMRWVQLAPKGAATSVTLVNWFETMPAGSLRGLVLHTPDLEGEVARLTAAGVKTSPIEAQPWGTYVTFSDPDGNGLVLQQRPSSRP
ncbi:MAG TPA: VOC family protein [Devosiaceae bacterium]|nr:VOC family protein [Devosiaceae bacterium]